MGIWWNACKKQKKHAGNIDRQKLTHPHTQTQQTKRRKKLELVECKLKKTKQKIMLLFY